MRIFGLDSHLVMGSWEVQTIKIPEHRITYSIQYNIQPRVYLAEDGEIMEEFLQLTSRGRIEKRRD